METYSSSNAAAHDPEERVQLHKPRHYTLYKSKRKRKSERRGRLTDLAKALDISWRTLTTTCQPLHRVVRIIISEYLFKRQKIFVINPNKIALANEPVFVVRLKSFSGNLIEIWFFSEIFNLLPIELLFKFKKKCSSLKKNIAKDTLVGILKQHPG